MPAFDGMFAGGFFPQGSAYSPYRYACILWSALIFEKMCGKGERVYGENLDTVAESLLYLIRPDGEVLRLGDEFYETKAPYTRYAPCAVPLFLAGVYTKTENYINVALGGMSEEYLLPKDTGLDYYIGGSYGEGIMSPTAFLIFYEGVKGYKTLDIKPYKYFGSPVGLTMWNDGRRVVLMKIGEYWGANHDHLDTGCFQIYCGGILASDSGVYDSYGSPHRRNYLIRTSAHNCLTVCEKSRNRYGDWGDDAPYDGGTRRPNGGREAKQLDFWLENYKMATVLSHTESDELCEIVGDMTEAYRNTCERAVRTMRWLPGKGELGTLIVTDNVIPKCADSEVAFRIHCQRKPEIDGNTVIIRNNNYKLVCRVNTPSDAYINAVGGEGKEFYIDGVNFPPATVDKTEAGWGQVTVSHPTGSKNVRISVEMEIMSL